MTTYFETKEQYLTFRKAWAKAVNDPRSKKEIIPRTDNVESYVVKGWLTAAHHVLFNILSNRPHHSGFTPITKATKLRSGALINGGLYHAVWELKHAVDHAKRGNNRMIESFLEPLKDVVSMELLASIEVPEEKPLDGCWGKGRKVAEQIAESNQKHITYDDIWNMYEEVA